MKTRRKRRGEVPEVSDIEETRPSCDPLERLFDVVLLLILSYLNPWDTRSFSHTSSANRDLVIRVRILHYDLNRPGSIERIPSGTAKDSGENSKILVDLGASMYSLQPQIEVPQ